MVESIRKIQSPRGVWVLSTVSLFMDISSEMIHSILPLFLISVLGANALQVGIIDGFAEATALAMRILSGYLSDRLRKRKAIMAVGYGLGVLMKPFFAIAGNVNVIFFARILDRAAKGIRSAPRDAMIADMVPPEKRGASFGLRQSMDNIGALVGPLIATALLSIWSLNFRDVFGLSVVPGLISLSIFLFYIHESQNFKRNQVQHFFDWQNIRGLGRSFWWITYLGGFISLARFSPSFIALRANEILMPMPLVPLVFVTMNFIYAFAAYPIGIISDRMDHWSLLMIGIGFLALSDLCFALPTISQCNWFVNWPCDWLPDWPFRGFIIMLGAALWGLQLGVLQSLFLTMVSVVAPTPLRATAFGVFSLVAGLGLFVSNLISGLVWEKFGSQATFFLSGTISLTALVGIWIKLNRERRKAS